MRQRLRSIGVVQTKNRRLREDIRCAEAAGVERIAFDLRRPSFVAFDEQTGGDAADRHRGRVEKRSARNELFGLPDVGNDLLGRLPRTRGDASERHRCAHQPQERAPRNGIRDRFDFRREFVVEPLLKSRIVRAFVERSPTFAAAGLGLAATAGKP